LTRRSNLYQLIETSPKNVNFRADISTSSNPTIFNQNIKHNVRNNPKKITKKTKKASTSQVHTNVMIWERSISKWHLKNLIAQTNFFKKESDLLFHRVRLKTTVFRKRQ